MPALSDNPTNHSFSSEKRYTFKGLAFQPDWLAQNQCNVSLERLSDKKTRQQLRSEWPADFPCPSDATLWRWLQRGVAGGLVCQEGTGRRADPFRYWLPSQLKEWQKDPMYEFHKMIEESQRQVLRELNRGRIGT